VIDPVDFHPGVLQFMEDDVGVVHPLNIFVRIANEAEREQSDKEEENESTRETDFNFGAGWRPRPPVSRIPFHTDGAPLKIRPNFYRDRYFPMYTNLCQWNCREFKGIRTAQILLP
jgi:hypothetical protein